MYALTVNVARRHLDQAARSVLVAQMRIRGMSIRDIAKATGLPKSTVSDVVQQLSEAGQLAQPERITGADGKERPATRPAPQPTPTPGPVEADEAPSAAPGPNSEPDGGAPTVAGSGPDLAEQVWQVLAQHGNPPFGLTVPEIWVKLPGVHSSAIPDALAALANAGRAVVMGTAEGRAPIEQRRRWLTRMTPEPAEAPSTAPAGSGPAPAPVADAPMPSREPDPTALVNAALDQHVPDVDAPKRDWGRQFYDRLKPIGNFTLWLDAEDAARFATDDDVETLRQLSLSLTDLHRRVVAARTATVTPLRRIK
jgi:transposase-like protein